MSSNTNKIKLAPRLRWGVGRDTHNFNFLKIGTILFIILSVGLTIRAGYLLISGENNQSNESPQVLGVTDQSPSNQIFTEYKVKKGDTLFTLSKEYNIEWTVLATLNNLKAPFDLHINQTIKIPKQ